jgi:nitrite reductase/ring-hydroxylating ferredoxin subunit
MSNGDDEPIVGLPMPRRPESLGDRTRRPIVRVRKPGEKRFPFPVPNGWFVVAESRELEVGQTRALHVFGSDVVLFRTERGEPRLVDAYCAHLGAHLGVGGRVEGDCIRCPFHGWLYDGASGRCREIPYDDSAIIPGRAKVRSYPTIERNQLIWAWHHLEEKSPFYEVPEVPEFEDPEWLPYAIREFDVATCCQEMAENNVDFAHFKYVHGSESIPDDEFTVDGCYKRTVGGEGLFVREGFGLGLGVLRINRPEMRMVFISSTTPLDDENVRVRWVFTAPRDRGDDAAEQAAEALSGGVSQDLPIWENKRYVAQPLVTKSEQKLLEQREWALQFYSGLELDPKSGATGPRGGER